PITRCRSRSAARSSNWPASCRTLPDPRSDAGPVPVTRLTPVPLPNPLRRHWQDNPVRVSPALGSDQGAAMQDAQHIIDTAHRMADAARTTILPFFRTNLAADNKWQTGFD